PLFAQMDTAVAAPADNAPLENAQLIIPSINVVQNIGIVPIVNGEWDVSALGVGVGHLTSTGVAPGGNLAMTFVGHATIPWPQAGAFADLIRLQHGEEIIYRWNGNDYIYEVSRILIVTPDFVEGIFEQNGNMLMLATCSGWSNTELDYTKRMITRAELVRVVPSSVDIKTNLIS
ncbi:MAG: sortase, partial [Chloroflexi bacterium]|nr:sortase [Chloroflexota bacterium]